MKKSLKIIFIIFVSIQILNSLFYSIKAQSEGKIELKTNKEKVEVNEIFTISVCTKKLAVAATTIKLYYDKEKVELMEKKENINVVNGVIIYTWFDEKGAKNLNENAKLVEFSFKAKQNGICSFALEGEFYNQNENEVKVIVEPIELKIGEEVIINKQDVQILEENKSQNNKNTNLAILRLNKEGISPNFQKEIKEYYITIDENINELEVIAIAENEKSKVNITGNSKLKNGMNNIVIKVTSENGKEEAEYKIYVTRTNNVEKANANLETLAIENTSLQTRTFFKDLTNYKVEVDNTVEKLNILAIPQNENAKVKIEGNENLKQGNNTILVTVTAENEITFKKYKISVDKKALSQIENEKTEKIEDEKVEKIENEVNEDESIIIDNSKEITEVENEIVKIQTKTNLLMVWSIVVIIAVLGIGAIVVVKRKKGKG